jgi:hypothetical protein
MRRWKRWIAAGVLGSAALIGAGAQAQALKEGDKAPAFSAPSTTGKALGPKDFPGKTVVLWFYIGAFTKT